MKQMKKNIINKLILMMSIGFLLVGGFLFYYEKNPRVYNTFAQAGLELSILDNLGKWEGEMDCGSYFSLVDELGKELDQISRFVFIGDEFILEDNNRYKVIRIDEKQNKAIAKLVEKENIAWLDEWDKVPAAVLAENQSKVAVYMTHTDESYVPTEGTESKPGNGGILQVGNTFANNLKEKGVKTQISFNRHDPHDANAYHRSRKTAVQLLKTNPIALVDVHRDGVPDPNFYKTQINGKSGTKIRLVVGRQNPHMSANLDFAKNIKAYFDKTSPGLIKGIYMGKGNYNQDLGPRSILIEVGTHTNSRTAAERGVAVFADGIPKVIGAVTVPGIPPVKPRLGGTGRAVLWLLGLVVIGGGVFLLLSTGSLQGSLDKLSGLGREFSNYLGPQKTEEEAMHNNNEQKKEEQQKEES